MAEQPYSTTRREIFDIVATAAIGVSLAIPASAASSSGAWDQARRAYLIADEAMRQYDVQFYSPASERHDAWRSQWPSWVNVDDVPAMKATADVQSALYDPIEERFDELTDFRHAAVDRLIATPAPSISAVAMKLEILIRDEEWACDGFDEKIQRILADLRRQGSH